MVVVNRRMLNFHCICLLKETICVISNTTSQQFPHQIALSFIELSYSRFIASGYFFTSINLTSSSFSFVPLSFLTLKSFHLIQHLNINTTVKSIIKNPALVFRYFQIMMSLRDFPLRMSVVNFNKNKLSEQISI